MPRHISIVILILALPLFLTAQFCTGTLGDNIFLEGDFGSGSPNLLSPNPGIAPGYNYTFNVPPFDGEYVITNNTASWSNLFQTWLGIGDNSSDPNGYMMVVNASNSPGLFYEQTVTGLCENTLYEFSADIINLIKTGTPDHISPNVSFLLNGVELFSTGDILQTNEWTTYGATFTTEVGQQSLTLSLRNNAPGGNGNDLAIDNISFRACGPETSVFPDATLETTICEGDNPLTLQAVIIGNQYVDPVVQWQESFDEGATWVDIVGETDDTYTHPPLTTGIYYYRFLVADGVSNLSSDKCRVNADPKIINVPETEFIQQDTICDGLTLFVGNSSYTTTGIYVDTLVSSFGCDSILTTDLTVSIDTSLMANVSVVSPCANSPDGSITIDSVSGGTPPFLYFFEGVDVGPLNVFQGLMGENTYSVMVQDDIGCTVELPVFLESLPELILELGDDQTVALGETVELSPFYNFTPSDFNWRTLSPVDCIDFEDCQRIDFLPTTSQQVALDLFTDAGCSVSDSLFIEVLEVRQVWFPNAFSPNADGVNDFFTAFGKVPNVSMIEELKIYDRWGGFIYEGKNLLPNIVQDGWNGTLDGEDLGSGLYIYTATVRFADDKVIRYSGEVALVR